MCSVECLILQHQYLFKTFEMPRRRDLRRNFFFFLRHSAQVVECAYDFLENDDKSTPKRKERSCWESDWLKRRPTEGVCSKLLSQLDSAGTDIERKLFTSFTRLSRDDFDCLHELVAPLIHKVDTNMRAAIPTRTRLALALYFLSTGNSYRSMQYLFLMSECTISKIIPETFLLHSFCKTNRIESNRKKKQKKTLVARRKHSYCQKISAKRGSSPLPALMTFVLIFVSASAMHRHGNTKKAITWSAQMR